jgi:hypothetical protein
MKRALTAALALVLPTAVAAQSTTITPSFAASEMYDSNLFVSASNPRQTLVDRFGPRLELARRSEAFSLVGDYVLDAEYLHARPEDGIHVARQLGAIKLRYRPTKKLVFEADAGYLDTLTPVELSTVTALDRGRVRAHHLSLGSSVIYQVDRHLTGELGYLFSRDDLLNLTADSHAAKADVAYRFTRTDTGSATLLFREFIFNGAALEPSQVTLLGWTRRFARRTSVAVHAGPRFRNAKTEGVEADATVHQGVGRAELDASYTRAETMTIGLPGTFETDAAAVSSALRVKPSLFRATAGVARTHGPGLQADVLHTRVDATTQVYPWLSVELSLTFTWQRFELAPAALGASAVAVGAVPSNRVFHDLVALALVVAPPKALEL